MFDKIIKNISKIIFRSRCSLCLSDISSNARDMSSDILCSSCLESIEEGISKENPRCLLCLKEIDSLDTNICSDCIPTEYMWDSIRAIVSYKGILHTILTQYKYEYKLSYVPILSHYLYRMIDTIYVDTQYDYILPIPLHSSKLYKRGFHQIWEILQYKKTKYPIRSDILLSAKRHNAQMTLSLNKRIENVAGIFVAKTIVSNKSILLVDDVITTGLSIHSAVNTLKKAGAYRVDCLALCHNDTVNKEALRIFMSKE